MVWQQKLVAADTDSHDRLGASVSIRGDVVAAGAPGAESFDVDPNMYLLVLQPAYFEGVWEQQEITCAATSGYLSWYSVVSLQLRTTRLLWAATGTGVNYHDSFCHHSPL